jgi:arabinofuranosyltransferase
MTLLNRKWFRYLLLGLAAMCSCGLFLALGAQIGGGGFPLDDAWIHQTFARTLAETGRWSFQGKELSGGSTGPLYGILLSALYLLGVEPIWGTYAIGCLLLWAAAVTASELAEEVFPGRIWVPAAAGMLIATEWHLVWAALSGMETMLLIVLSLSVFCVLCREHPSWTLLGLLIGVTVWIRPDGITLLGPAGVMLLLGVRHKRITGRQIMIFCASFSAIAAGYFFFNWVVAGDLWPNTFYAKQAEYASAREGLFLLRYLRLSKQFLTGIGASLVPGLIIETYLLIKRRGWALLTGAIWVLGYIGIYAWRLPVDYQHGRYLMPAMPMAFLLGALGLIDIWEMPEASWITLVVKKAWGISAVAIALVFLVLGARAYGMDLAVINSEMVATAKWVSLNTAPGSVIGAHDIGALGYFSQRKILDLAGLVTPDVIPFIRNEDELKNYLSNEGVDYLVTFPSWYPDLTSGLEIVYQADSPYTVKFGMDNMTVFRWRQ